MTPSLSMVRSFDHSVGRSHFVAWAAPVPARHLQSAGKSARVLCTLAARKSARQRARAAHARSASAPHARSACAAGVGVWLSAWCARERWTAARAPRACDARARTLSGPGEVSPLRSPPASPVCVCVCVPAATLLLRQFTCASHSRVHTPRVCEYHTHSHPCACPHTHLRALRVRGAAGGPDNTFFFWVYCSTLRPSSRVLANHTQKFGSALGLELSSYKKDKDTK